MLTHISSLWDYRDFLALHLHDLDLSQIKRLHSRFRVPLAKLRKLDISLASDLLFPLYSSNDSPAIDPAVLLRSFVLMKLLKYDSIHRWCDGLADSLLQYLIGSFSPARSDVGYQSRRDSCLPLRPLYEI